MQHLVFSALLVVCITTYTLAGVEENVITIASLSNELAADIHKKLSAQDENIIFSPFGIATTLAMIHLGARGKTAEEMRRVLGYQDERLTNSEVNAAFKSLLEQFTQGSTKDYVLYAANAIMTQKGFPITPEYKNGVQSTYMATAREVDFQNDATKALQAINDWVKLKTNNQIEKLLDAVDPATIMVILNAMYFKGTWKTEFDPQDTFDGVFYNRGLESERVTVPMMMLKEELPSARFGGVRVLELPYRGEDISMAILLPDARNGLPRLEQELQRNFWRDVLRQTRKSEITVTIPKFKLEFEKNLNEVLQGLGIKSLFNNPDLSGISTAGQLEVSKIIHKAVIEVNEEGSEASSITGGLIDFKIGGDNNNFNLNHPFIFAIVDKRNDLVLFQGRVNTM